MCTQCQMLMINGIPCHETGCPEAWKDKYYECSECGCPMSPEHKPHNAKYLLCEGCANTSIVDGWDMVETDHRLMVTPYRSTRLGNG